MLLNTWNNVLTDSFQNLWGGVIAFIPNLLVAIIIFVLGWVVGIVLGQWVSRLIKSIQVDKALKNVGAEEVLGKAGFRLDSGAFIGGLVKWFVIVAFLVASFNVLGLSQVNDFLAQVLNYLPRVIIASLILILAAAIADVLTRVVTGSVRAAGITSSNIFGSITKWAVWVFAIFAAIDQLGVLSAATNSLVVSLLGGVVNMLTLALGLAFGLGGKEAASRYLERLREDMKNHHHQ
ncbi:MAG TPA: hypothetical protein VJB69_03295 [Candidatus Paceibacterota bacterium]